MDLIAYILAKKAGAQGVAEEKARAEQAEEQLQNNIDAEAAAREAEDEAIREEIATIEAKSDVVDVVGTYAELQAYDTSTLADKDIIKVLHDENEDNATTYYRYDKEHDSFSLIGSLDPYYNKTQTDELFAAEEDAREQADSALDNKIDTEISDRTADVDAEEARAIAVEAGLQSQIDTINDKSFKDDWVIDGTVEQLAASIYADSSVKVGDIYFNDLQISKSNDYPFNGNGEVIVEIIGNPDISAGKRTILITLTSGTESPYQWQYTYWQINGSGRNSGWKSFIPTENVDTANLTDNDLRVPSSKLTKAEIAAEETRAKDVEEELEEAITAEEDRAIEAENILRGQIVSEETRAKNAEDALDNAKQDVIADLADIRSGAALGATALQAEALDDYYTKSEVDAELANKQDAIDDLEGIRAGAALGDTALQPGDNVSELVNDAGYLADTYADNLDIAEMFPVEASNVTELRNALNSNEPVCIEVSNNISSTSSFVINNADAEVKIDLDGGTVESRNDCALKVNNGARLVISGEGDIKAQEFGVIAFSGSDVEINGGTFTTTDNVIFGTNGTSGQGENTIVINDGTFNGHITSAGYIACGVYAANNDNFILNGGTFNIYDGCGICARSGNVVVNDGVVFNFYHEHEPALTEGKVGDSKVLVPVDERFVLDLRAVYPGGSPSITINGVTIDKDSTDEEAEAVGVVVLR